MEYQLDVPAHIYKAADVTYTLGRGIDRSLYVIRRWEDEHCIYLTMYSHVLLAH